MTNLQSKLTEFADLVTGYTRDFIGREWLTRQVIELLNEPDCRFIILIDGPGTGKTAFLAHLAAIHPDWPRYFIRRDSHELLLPGDAKTFLLNIGGQLAKLYPEAFHPENLELVVHQRLGKVDAEGKAIGMQVDELYASPFYTIALHAEQQIERLAGEAIALSIGHLVNEARLLSIQDLQYLGIIAPAKFIARINPNIQIVILVDALDELRYSPAEPDILRALRELPEIPSNLRFVISSRPEAFLDRLLARSDARKLSLEVGEPPNLVDLRAYAEHTLDALMNEGLLEHVLAEERLHPKMLIEGLLSKADGNFLYLKSIIGTIREFVADETKRDRVRLLLHAQELPSNLSGLYDYFLQAIVVWAEKRGFGDDAWIKYLSRLLGVLAVAQESLSEEQLVTFTGLKRTEIHNLLRELRQFVELVEGQPAVYRIYHTSFAEHLLDSESNHNYWIEEQEAHRNIVAGLRQGCASDWPKLAADPYAHRYLSIHLRLAGEHNELFTLVDNHAWYKTQLEADPSSTTYLNDLAQAWIAAEWIDAAAIYHGQLAPLVQREVHCALASASLNSFSANLPTELLTGLLKSGLWTPDQVLAAARHKPDAEARTIALANLIPYLPDPIIKDDLVHEVLAAVSTVIHSREYASILALLVPHLPESLLSQVLEAARTISSGMDRARALAAFVPRLAKDERQLVLREAIVAIQEESRGIEDRARTLAALASPLTVLSDELLDAARALPTSSWIEGSSCPRSQALTALAPHLPKKERLQVEREALAAVLAIEDSYLRANALGTLAPQLPRKMLPEILAAVLAIPHTNGRTRALISLVPHFGKKRQQIVLQEALAAARALQNDGYGDENRAWALAKISSYLPETIKGSILREVFDIAKTQPDTEILLNKSGATIFAHVAEYLPKPFLLEALGAAQEINDVDEREWLLGKLAPFLAKTGCLQEAMAAMQAIGDTVHRERVLAKLSICLGEAGHSDEALTMARMIEDAEVRVTTLVKLVSHLPESLLPTMVEIVQTIGDKPQSAFALAALGNTLPEGNRLPLLHTGIEIARTIGNEETRAQTLALLIPHLPQDERSSALSIALEAARVIRWENSRAIKLAFLSAYLPDSPRCNVFEEALDALHKIEGTNSRILTLERMVSHMPGPPFSSKEIQLALAFSHQLGKDIVLARLASRLAEIGSLPEAVETLKQIVDIHERAKALAELTPYLSEVDRKALLHEVLNAAEEIQDANKRVETLAILVPYLPTRERLKELNVLLRMVGANTSIWTQARILTNLAPYLSKKLRTEAGAIAQNISDVESRIGTLAALVPEAERPPLLRELLSMFRTHKDSEEKAQYLVSLLPFLSEQERPPALRDALAAALAIEDDERRRYMLHILVSHLVQLSPSVLYPLWRTWLHTLAARSRANLLSDLVALAPALFGIGGRVAVTETASVIQNIMSWWP